MPTTIADSGPKTTPAKMNTRDATDASIPSP
jgi:hypothetical protein